MRMGTAQKQNIAVQHAYFNRHGGRRTQRPIPMSFKEFPQYTSLRVSVNERTQRPTPMSFKEWLLRGIEHYKKQGFSFELVTLA